MSIKRILLPENLKTYAEGDEYQLYHYSKTQADTLMLDPHKFASNTYSRNEKKTSSFPRLFFYLDPAQKERWFASDVTLYSTKVSRSEIYDLMNDPLNIIDKVKRSNQGVLNFDMLFKSIKNKGYNGVYYSVHGRDIVSYFKSIEVRNVSTSKEIN